MNDRPATDVTLALVDDVEGWMTPGQGRALIEAAASCPPNGRIVEIGSFHGRSTIVLASSADPSVEVIAIDPHAGNDRGPEELTGFKDEANKDRDAFNANLRRAGVVDRVRHIPSFSAYALEEVEAPIDVLYIDGAHRYTPALADIRAWGDRVTDGGTMLIHDSFSSIGVTRAIGRTLIFGSKFRYVKRSRSLAIYRADLGSGIGAQLLNAGLQIVQLPWFFKNVGLKIVLKLGGGRLWTIAGRVEPEWPY